MGNKIKILICYHKKDVLLKDDILTPIHVGRALAKERMGEDNPQYKWLCENMPGDDTGENISGKNPSYNELTSIYWAWKNYKALGNPDYIGLMHYRRHFIFRESYDVVENVSGIDENYFKRINYSADLMSHLFDDCDYVAHIGHVDEVYKHYKENHHVEDLELAIDILKKMHPGYAATAEAYLKMSYVNLCNMFIMPRDMFFEYCGWLFGILEEFERQVDLADKRLFISERLTGIFIEHQKRKGLRQKALPATFVHAVTRVPVVMPYCSDVFRTAVTMSSILKHAELSTFVDFYLLHDGSSTGAEFDEFIKQYPGNSVTYVDVPEMFNKLDILPTRFEFPIHYPLVAADVLPGLNKFIYSDERSFFFGDITRFYLACNNDEFAVLGLPQNNPQGDVLLRGNVFSINGARLRAHNFLRDITGRCADLTAAEVFTIYAKGQVGYFPWWLYNVSDVKKDGKLYYKKNRGDQRWDIWSHALLYYCNGMEPWTNIQGLYSVFWWEVAAKVTSCIPFMGIEEAAIELWCEQTAQLCVACGRRKEEVKGRCLIKRSLRFLRHYGLKRAMKYLKYHGFKHTVKKLLQKLRGEK